MAAEVIKKISAFDSLPVSGITTNTYYIVAKEGYNYKVSFGDMYSAIDWYLANNETNNIKTWANSTFTTYDKVNNALALVATKSDVEILNSKIQNLATSSSIENINSQLSTFLTHDSLDTEITTAINVNNAELNNIYAPKSTVYTKSEVDTIVNTASSNTNVKILQNTTDIESIVSQLEVVKSDIQQLNDLTNSAEHKISTDGEGTKLLGDDGKYHDISAMSFIQSNSITLTEDMVDENNLVTVNVEVPKLPFKSIIEYNVEIAKSTFDPAYITGIDVASPERFNSAIKTWKSDSKRFANVTFENEINLTDTETHGKLNYIARTKTYIDGDLVTQKLNVKEKITEVIHDTYNVVVKIQLTDKLPKIIAANASSKITFRVFGYK